MKIKICCISSVDEAETAIELGADAIGLVSEMPSGPGVIDNETIELISSATKGRIDSFLLTSKTNVLDIVEQHKRFKTTTIQIVDRLLAGTHEQLKSILPDINIVQVIHVNDEESIKEAKACSNHVDALLLDSGNQKLAIKELGGTGRTHDWSLSKKIVDSVHIPVYLAGGLNPENILSAIDFVKPYGVDICSGVRSNGSLDKIKLTEYIKKIRSLN